MVGYRKFILFPLTLKYSKDIEFFKQSIGHQKLDTTSAYVTKLSDQERQDRITDV